MNATLEKPAYFHALAAFKLRPNRLYRVYVLPDQLVFIYVGSGGELASSLALLSPVMDIGPFTPFVKLLINALDPSTPIAERLQKLDGTPLKDMIGDHKHNFRATLSELSGVRLEPKSIAHAELYSDPFHVSLLTFKHSTQGRFTLGICSAEDMMITLEKLPLLLGERLNVNGRWDEAEQRLVSISGVEDFGNGFRHLKRLAIVGLILAAPVLFLVLGVTFAKGRLAKPLSVDFWLGITLLWGMLLHRYETRSK